MVMVKSINLPGRLVLSYFEQGDPEGPPVLLLHGVSDSCRSFAPLLRHLPPSLHVFALSQRGHGDSGAQDQGTVLRILPLTWTPS